MSTQNAQALTARQERALASLAGGSTWIAAAEAAGVTVRQLARWRQLPAFAQGLQAATAAAFEGGLRVAAAGLEDAARYLGDAAAGRIPADPARTSAARALLQLAPGLREHVDLESRLAALEAASAAVGGEGIA